MKVQKNQIYYADLNPVQGSEQGGIRPVLIIQNDIGNKASPTVIIAAITSKGKKKGLPTHVAIKLEEGSLPKESMAMLEQIRTIDKDRLIKYVGRIDTGSANAIERASLASLGIDIYKTYQRLYT
jgi:mRNA interferase MazF